MKKNIRSAICLMIVISIFFFVPTIAGAPKVNNKNEQSFSIFMGGGYKNFLQAQDTFNALYDSSNGIVMDAGMKLDIERDFYVSAEVYLISKTGERVWVSSEGTAIKTGISEDLTLIPLTATLGYYLMKSKDVQVYLGVGAGFYLVQIDCAIDDYDRNESGTGFFGTIGADFFLSDSIYLTIEAKYESVTGLIGYTGVPAIFEEDDLGGILILGKIGFRI
jgi:outer membrane protein W